MRRLSGVQTEVHCLFVMHQAQANTIKPAAPSDKGMSRITHVTEKHDRVPPKGERLDSYLMAISGEGSADRAISSFEPGGWQLQNIRVVAIEQAIGGASVNPCPQFNALLAVN